MSVVDTDHGDDFDDDGAELSPQMRDQLDRLILHNRALGHGGRTRSPRQWVLRRRIEDWHDTRAVQRSVDHLGDDLGIL